MTEHVIYYNTSISNPSTATAPIPATFSQKFSSPLLRDVENKQMSIIRFSLPISGAAYFQYTQNSFNITISFNGVDYKQNVNISSLDGSSGVVYLGQLLTGLNSAIQTAFSALVAANNSSAQFQNAPFVKFNPATQLFSILFDGIGWINTPTFNAATTAQLFFCTPLFQLFNNMESQQVAINSASGKDNLIIVEARKSNVTTPAPVFFTTLTTNPLVAGTAYTTLPVVATPQTLQQNVTLAICNGNPQQQLNYVQLSAIASAGSTSLSVASFTSLYAYAVGSPIYTVAPQQVEMFDESSSAVDWLSISSIQITSSLLPIRPEFNGAGYLAGANPAVLQGSFLLTDFVSYLFCECLIVVFLQIVPVADRLSSNSEIVYLAYAPYRRIDLAGCGPLTQLDFTISVKDKFGNISVLQIPPGGNCDVKFVSLSDSCCLLHFICAGILLAGHRARNAREGSKTKKNKSVM